jgi:hypothetical protein
MDILGTLCRVPTRSALGAEALTEAPLAAPPAAPSVEQRALTGLKIAGYVAAPIAVGVSYARNESGPLAILHGLIGLPYLVYVGAKKLMKKD